MGREDERNLSEQLLTAMEKRHRRERYLWVLAVSVLALSVGAYIWWRLMPTPVPAPVAMSHQQAQTAQGVLKAAELDRAPISLAQAEEAAAKIKTAGDRPDQVVAAAKEDVREVIEAAVKKADLAIVTPSEPAGRASGTQLNVYNIKAYPERMLGVGLSNRSWEIVYLKRVNVPHIPLLLPKGGVDYAGPYVSNERSPSRHSFGVKLLMPLD